MGGGGKETITHTRHSKGYLQITTLRDEPILNRIIRSSMEQMFALSGECTTLKHHMMHFLYKLFCVC